MRSAALIAAVAGLLALGVINVSIMQKESLLKEGEVVYLELAPVDPRSLMQGDYMALQFQVGNEIRAQLHKQFSEAGKTGSEFETHNGVIVVALDENRVGRFERFDDRQVLKKKERRMRFRVRNGRVKFATNAFFFQEGTVDVYSLARYGEFRVAKDGDLLLTGMRDNDLKKLGPDAVVE
jgi:uncharacterized membrane-anchored protein